MDEVRLYATSHDGTKVPVTLLYRKSTMLTADNPTLLVGYGAYGISQVPVYDPTRLAWLERGGIIAFAHIRGGGEYGEAWHRAGQKATKENTILDFIACAEFLVKYGFTSPQAARGPGHQRGRHSLGRGHGAPSGPLRRGRAARGRARHAALRVRGQRAGQHPGVRLRGHARGVRGAAQDVRLPPGEGRHGLPRGPAHHRHERPARRSLAGGQDGRAPPGGLLQRQARAHARRMAGRPRAGIHAHAARGGTGRHLCVPDVAVRRGRIRACGGERRGDRARGALPRQHPQPAPAPAPVPAAAP